MSASISWPLSRPFDGLSWMALLPVLLAALTCLLLSSSIGLGDRGHVFLEFGWALQALTLACSGATLALQADAQLQAWERRCAPAAGRVRALQRLRVALLSCLGLGLLGPLSLVLATEWRDQLPLLLRYKALFGASLLMLLALLAGTSALLAWQGRAPRIFLLAPLPLIAGLLMIESVWPLLPASPLVLIGLALAGIAGSSWRWLGDADALHAVGSRRLGDAWLAPGLELWRSLRPRWQSLPFEDQLPETGNPQYPLTASLQPRATPLPNWSLSLLIGAQGLMFHRASDFLHWGTVWQADSLWRHAVWLGLLVLMASLAMASNDLHWRRSLAPGAGRRSRFGLDLLLCSLGRWALLLAAVALAACLVALYEPAAAITLLSALPAVVADLLLVTAVAACLRGWRNHRLASLLGSLAFGLLSWGALRLASELGWSPMRGMALLAAQTLLALLLGLLAIHLWRRYDLGRLSALALLRA
jgi:hypothetical protein